MKVLKRFLYYCHEIGFIGLDCSLLFPSNKLRSHTEIPSVYTPEEVFQLLEYIRNSGSANKRRNYAIAALIAVYGFRVGDIMKMKLSDIDWENETISVVQSKTKQLLTHKLTCHTDNALADYNQIYFPMTPASWRFPKPWGMPTWILPEYIMVSK